MSDTILTEDYCCECDETVHQVFSEKDFFAHKVGRIRCPNCGHAILPCNECEDHDACGNCPWKKAAVYDAMSDEAYIRHLRTDDPELYKMFKSGDMGDHFMGIIEKVERELKNEEKRVRKNTKKKRKPTDAMLCA